MAVSRGNQSSNAKSGWSATQRNATQRNAPTATKTTYHQAAHCSLRPSTGSTYASGLRAMLFGLLCAAKQSTSGQENDHLCKMTKFGG